MRGGRLEQLLDSRRRSIINVCKVGSALHAQTLQHVSQRSTIAHLVRILQALECRRERYSSVTAVILTGQRRLQ